MAPLFQAPCSTVLLDREGRLLCAAVAPDGQWRFPPPDSLPPRFVACLLQFEDRHFMEHHGVHLPSMVRAMRQNSRAGHVVSGGSTLTMQLARLSLNERERSYGQKIQEVLLALRVELRTPKADILKQFAANAPFGGNVVGIDAAAWRWFGRPAHDLGWAECATLAVLPNAPSAIYPGKGHDALKRKRDRLLDRLMIVGFLDSVACQLAKEEPLPGKAQPLPYLAPHLMATLATTGHAGTTVRTTIDAHLQQRATEAIAHYAAALEANELHNAALLILDVPTGRALAYVGNNPLAGNGHAGAVDIARRPRSTGSLLKPFLYADMLQCGELLPDMLVADVPTHYAGFTPRNTDGHFSGAVPASRALARSLNVPAVRALRKHGVARTLRTLNAMGLHSLDRGADHYGLSLMVGGGESSLWELAGAYASMARTVNEFGRTSNEENLGLVHPPIVVDGVVGARVGSDASAPVLSASAIHFTLQAMRSVNRPDVQSGWQCFSGGQPIAWKTGTSYGHRDAWAIGVTDRWCVAVWTGNASGEGRPGNTGTLAAAPLLFEMFGLLPASDATDPPYDEMVRTLVCNRSGHRAGAHCEHADSTWIPAVGMRTPPCPYHRMITVDATGNFRTTDAVGMRQVSWFVLPPAMEHYTAPGDPTYLSLPPWADGTGATTDEVPFALIYPEPGTRLLIPLELDGTPGNAVFEATHRQLNGKLHWHVDGIYLGATVGDHRMAMSPAEGEHRITLADPTGASVNIPFTVVAGKRQTP